MTLRGKNVSLGCSALLDPCNGNVLNYAVDVW